MVDEEKVIEEVLRKYKNIATIGFSKDPSKPAHEVPRFLISKGYNVIPVNPTVNEILGRKSYKSILDIPEKIEVVEVFRPSSEVPKIVDEVLERVKMKGDVKVIWLQEGIRHDEAAEKARKAGLVVIQDRCMYKEYVKKIGS
ncbi:CoA-binding protein [Sulfolobus acidocaldarius]|uniref:CoA-binding protein n=4 Tax=Sulfolobus acidocaldarius TaxID=2285 RepID=Q4JC91_SULAC|nr:CoA-binding protein [Sulfolobus acidocaldarius]AAY79588.1 CoA-binding protein [Sulfolobus acidocaldarius DSM 639]AGE70141.1 CoA-binding protein [Sulfolobus acidocaldarius N8]AGE72416.1 CoA-binding protein [Sulfolobus acidocaldarius Ron12/I]ALU29446.1 CoA-binding protein [Sulfolobus acidocaldarius]ALU32175.1 CoA-binding protein [Sulfolobus acidocaldarius]